MNRRLSLFALLSALLVAIAGSASAAPVPVTLIAPLKAEAVTHTELQFRWTAPGAERFKFVLKSADGTQKLAFKSLTVQGSCYNGVCGLLLNPLYHNWDWRENMTYTWKVVAMKANGKIVGTAKSSFVTDLLPDLTTLAPVNNAPPVLDYVIFSWPDSMQVSQYRVVVTAPNGQKIISPWLGKYNVCSDGICGYYASFLVQGHGQYKWRLEAMRNDVLGTVKSAKQTFNIGFAY